MEPCATQSSILLRSGWALQRHHLRTLRSASRKFADTNWSSRNLKLKLKMLLLPPINMKVAQANLLEGKRLAWNGLEGTITVLPEHTWTKTKTDRWFFNKHLTWIEIAREKLPCKHRSCNQQAGNSKSQPQGLASKQKCQTRSCCRLLAS